MGGSFPCILLLLGRKMLSVMPKTSFNRGSLNQGSTLHRKSFASKQKYLLSNSVTFFYPTATIMIAM